MTKELIIGSLGLSFFIICPRMAGMVHVIAKNSDASLMTTAFLGSLVSIPLVLLIVMVFGKFGVTGALIFCVLTDFAAAFIMKELSLNAAVETFVIALFVISGVKLAPFITSFFTAS